MTRHVCIRSLGALGLRERPLLLAVALAIGAPIATLACDDKKAPDSARPDASASTDKYAAADPKLAKVLAAASASAAAAESGPPPEGIFPPGVADQRHPKSMPAKIEMPSDGSEPRISLAAPDADGAALEPRASSFGPLQLQAGMQLQAGRPIAFPTIDFAVLLGPGAKDDPPDVLLATVKKAVPAKEQLGQLPPGADKEVATLEGTEIRMRIADGRARDVSVKTKAQHDEIARLANNLAESLEFATVPIPPKPVGVGAQWIAESRMSLSGFDVIAYRAYRVKSIDKDRVHLTVDVRAYAASKDVQLEILPKGTTAEQFAAGAQGELELVRGETLARKSDVEQHVAMVLQVPGQQPPQGAGGKDQPQGMLLEIKSAATMLRGEDLKAAEAAATKHP